MQVVAKVKKEETAIVPSDDAILRGEDCHDGDSRQHGLVGHLA